MIQSYILVEVTIAVEPFRITFSAAIKVKKFKNSKMELIKGIVTWIRFRAAVIDGNDSCYCEVLYLPLNVIFE